MPPATKRIKQFAVNELKHFGFASEVAWRLLAIDYRKTLDDILCSPEFASEFDRLAAEFGPKDIEVSSLNYRRAALSIRKRSHDAREAALAEKFSKWMSKKTRLPSIELDGRSLQALEQPGVFLLCDQDVGFYAGESANMRAQVERLLGNEKWASLEPSHVKYIQSSDGIVGQYAIKSALAMREYPQLNCRLLMQSSELTNLPM